LDEPTAHLDPENAAAVRTAVTRLLEGRTAVIVAHDTAWARAALGDSLRPVSLPLPTPEASESL
jgi:ATP-binding cassette subfamily C protein CydD